MQPVESNSVQEDEPQPSTSKENHEQEERQDTNVSEEIDKVEDNKSDAKSECHHQNPSETSVESQETVSSPTVLNEDTTVKEESLRGRTLVKPQITITANSSPSPERKALPERQLDSGKNSPSDKQSKGKCPIYFGIRSYLHNFYDPPDKDVVNSGEYIQEDDFEFVIEPGKRRWQGCWFRTGLWVGINLILVGVIALLVGYLTPPRNTIVGHEENLEILDRWAISFNHHLELCRLAGLIVFCCGGIVVMVTILVSSYQPEPTYYVMGAAGVPQVFVGSPVTVQRQQSEINRIPITGSIRSVQPVYLCPKVK